MLLLLLSIFFFQIALQQQLSDSEEEALLELFTETGGVIWRRQFDLDDLCNSRIVECDNGHVIELNLNDNNLHGKLPKSLKDLSSLEVLDVRDNTLIGEIPDDIFDIDTLQTVFLDGNYFNCPIIDYRYITSNDFSSTNHCDNYPCDDVDTPCDCTEYHCGDDWGWSKSDGCVEGGSTSEEELLLAGCDDCVGESLCDCGPEWCDVGWGWGGDVDGGRCEFDKTTTTDELVEAGCYTQEGECVGADVCDCLEEDCGENWGWDSTSGECLFGASTTHAELEEGGCRGCFNATICDCTEDDCPSNWGWSSDNGRCEFGASTNDDELYENGCTNRPPETSEPSPTDTPSIPSTPSETECLGEDLCDCTEGKCGDGWGWSKDDNQCLHGSETTQTELEDAGCPLCSNRGVCRCTDLQHPLIPQRNCEVGWGWSSEDGACQWGAVTTDDELIENNCIGDPEVCGSCASIQSGGGCDHQETEDCVCNIDSFCCTGDYDAQCALIAFESCGCTFDARPTPCDRRNVGVCDCNEDACGVGWGWDSEEQACVFGGETKISELIEARCDPELYRCENVDVCECTEANCGDNWGWNQVDDACVYGGETKTSELVAGGCDHCANVRNVCNCTEDAGCPVGWGWDTDSQRCEFGKSTSDDELVAGGCIVHEDCLEQENGRWEAGGSNTALAQLRASSPEDCCRNCLVHEDCLWSWNRQSQQCILLREDEDNDKSRPSSSWVRGPGVVG